MPLHSNELWRLKWKGSNYTANWTGRIKVSERLRVQCWRSPHVSTRIVNYGKLATHTCNCVCFVYRVLCQHTCAAQLSHLHHFLFCKDHNTLKINVALHSLSFSRTYINSRLWQTHTHTLIPTKNQSSASALLGEQVSIPAVRAGLSSEVEAFTVGTDTMWNAITTQSKEMQWQEAVGGRGLLSGTRKKDDEAERKWDPWW